MDNLARPGLARPGLARPGEGLTRAGRQKVARSVLYSRRFEVRVIIHASVQMINRWRDE